jgi:hypothetical protein
MPRRAARGQRRTYVTGSQAGRLLNKTYGQLGGVGAGGGVEAYYRGKGDTQGAAYAKNRVAAIRMLRAAGKVARQSGNQAQAAKLRQQYVGKVRENRQARLEATREKLGLVGPQGRHTVASKAGVRRLQKRRAINRNQVGRMGRASRILSR